ncbi:serine protease [Vitiosangium sp. GDMCC 1.1324]|uniref:serine protease n=1 Tax=Vitiosangium sp. (strain GDMCC 1.1324) TaxID=2138576 RepID=UPI000D369547|nr:serine protease [Vitiosangium sp. GDMCC 1.1324]PTL76207.1 serine protease [Vitiosangium sp. GDMCC 1.1324]
MRSVCAVVAAVGLLGCGGEVMEPEQVDAMDTIGQEIVGGVEARPGSHPWIVSLQQYGSHFCGGSLIRVSPTVEASDIVVTAAHCVYDGSSGLTVVAGAHDLNRPGAGQVSVSGERAVYHSAYNPDTTLNDIAIIKLAKPIKFSSTIQPVFLPQAGEAVPDNTLGTVAGWGLTREGGYDTSSILMQVSVPTINSRELASMYSKEGISIDPKAMLGAGYRQGGKDSCQGDSGGPFVFKNGNNYVLQGIVSFGVGCARPGLPGVYTRVSSYISWINQQRKVLSSL